MGGEQRFFIAAACFLIWCYDKKAGWRAGFIFLTGTVLNGVLKNIFRVARPIGRENVISMRTHTASGYSFPSGHTQGAALFWFAMMKIYRKKLLYVAGTIIIILVGLSRLYLGVHWPSDVLGGIITGAIWVFIADRLWTGLNITGNIKSAALTVAVMAVICIFFPDTYIIRTTGAAAGFISGIHLDRKFLNYTPSPGLLNNTVKMAAGFAVIAILLIATKKILPAGVLSRGLCFTFIGFWITFGAPYLFTFSAKFPGRA